MAYATEISISSQSGLATRALATLAAARGYFTRRAIYSQTFRELTALSNRELADLGINRCEIRRISMEAAKQI